MSLLTFYKRKASTCVLIQNKRSWHLFSVVSDFFFISSHFTFLWVKVIVQCRYVQTSWYFFELTDYNLLQSHIYLLTENTNLKVLKFAEINSAWLKIHFIYFVICFLLHLQFFNLILSFIFGGILLGTAILHNLLSLFLYVFFFLRGSEIFKFQLFFIIKFLILVQFEDFQKAPSKGFVNAITNILDWSRNTLIFSVLMEKCYFDFYLFVKAKEIKVKWR